MAYLAGMVAGTTAALKMQVTGSWERQPTVDVSDSEGYGSVPRNLSLRFVEVHW